MHERCDPTSHSGRRALARLILATGLASVGLAAGGTGGALLASELAGSESVAGLPFGLVVAGSAAGAVLVGFLTRRIGRLSALAVGYGISVGGAGIVIAGSTMESLPLVLAGSLLLGPANAAVFLGRYGGADLAGEDRRGRGLGMLLFATAFGAAVAPNLLGPAGVVAEAIGLRPVTGLYLAAIAVFGAAAVILAGRVNRPWSSRSDGLVTAAARMGRLPRFPVPALVVLAAANASMAGLMAVVPVHLTAHGHDLSFVGLVISIHVVGMLAPSPATGWLVDRIGPGPAAAAGALLLAAAGTWGAVTPHGEALPTTGFLLVLGLGWNLSVVGGSAMLTSQLPVHARPAAEAAGEVAMGLSAAIVAPLTGLLAAGAGWPVAALASGVVGCLGLIGALHRHPAGPARGLADAAGAEAALSSESDGADGRPRSLGGSHRGVAKR